MLAPVLSFSAAQARRHPTRPPRIGGAGIDQASPVCRVLLVEDDEGIRESLAELLSEDGFDVRVACNGADALKVLRGEPAPDVIVLDLMMPVMDGWRFRIEQKGDPRFAQIPVIAMSTNATSQARAIDAAAFAAKPVHVDELRQTIERVVSGARAARIEHTDRLAALGTLTAGVAHEISNPLTYVIANLDQLSRELPAALDATHPHLTELVSEALDGAHRITEIVRNVQTIARLVRDQGTSLVDLRTCVEQSVKMVQHEIRQRADLQLRLDPVPPVRASAARLEQVVTNLLLNAVRSLPDRPRSTDPNHLITVATKTLPDGSARFEISDTGPGVPAHLTEQIFEPFFSTRPAGAGTGLGLSICQSIIRDAGGQIGVARAPSGGALFWFELPALAETDTIQARSRTLRRIERRLTIVAIDDDTHVLGALIRIAGPAHDIIVARNLDHGVALCRRHRPDLVLLDVMIPGSSVEGNLDRLSLAVPEVAGRIVLMTGGAFTEAEQEALTEAGCPVVAKPFTLDELVEATWSLIRT